MSLDRSTVRPRALARASTASVLFVFVLACCLVWSVDGGYVLTQIVQRPACPYASDSSYDAVNNVLYTGCGPDIPQGFPDVGGVLKIDLNTNAYSWVITMAALPPNKDGYLTGITAVDFDPATNMIAFAQQSGHTYTIENGVFTRIATDVDSPQPNNLYIDRVSRVIYAPLWGSPVVSWLNGVRSIVATMTDIDYPNFVFRDEALDTLYVGQLCIVTTRGRLGDSTLLSIAGTTWTSLVKKTECSTVYGFHKVKSTGMIYLACYDQVISLAPNGAITLLLANTVCYGGMAIGADPVRGVLYVACPSVNNPYGPGPGLIVMPIGGGPMTVLLTVAQCASPDDIDVNQETGTVYVSGGRCGVWIIGQTHEQTTEIYRHCIRMHRSSPARRTARQYRLAAAVLAPAT
jgi:hypothetical protein